MQKKCEDLKEENTFLRPLFADRMVTEAQSREAPVQRLADTVAGWFCYGVMTASAGTFAFWCTLGKLQNIIPVQVKKARRSKSYYFIFL